MTRVEMLWESCDPLAALVERFGFDAPAAAATWMSDVVTDQWHLPAPTVHRLVLSGSNLIAWIDSDDGPRIAKVSAAAAEHARLAHNIDLVIRADSSGVPVSVPLPSANGRRQVAVDGFAVSLQQRLGGAMLDVTVPAQVASAGATLARLHQALADHPRPRDMKGRWDRPMTELIDHRHRAHAGQLPAALLDRLGEHAAAAGSLDPPRQFVHLDFRSANVVMDGDAVAAVLDFEDAAVAAPVLDLARAATLLGTRFRDWAPISAAVRAQFLAAYTRVRPLDEAERAWLPALLLSTALAMVPVGADPQGWGSAARVVLSDEAGSVGADPPPRCASGTGGDEGDG